MTSPLLESYTPTCITCKHSLPCACGDKALIYAAGEAPAPAVAVSCIDGLDALRERWERRLRIYRENRRKHHELENYTKGRMDELDWCLQELRVDIKSVRP